MRTVLLLTFYGVYAILLIPVVLFAALLKWPAPVIAAGRFAVRVARPLLGIRLEVIGLDKFDRCRSYVFMPNHLSMLDGPLIYIQMPRFVHVIVKKELFRVPVLGWGMRVVGFVPVDRKGQQGGRLAIARAARLIREKGFSFLVFPEGTRSADGRLQELRRGGFFLALDSGAPIVPVSIAGTYPLLPKGGFSIKPGRVRIVFHDPIPLDGFDRDHLPVLIDKVRAVIQSGLEQGQDAAEKGSA